MTDDRTAGPNSPPELESAPLATSAEGQAAAAFVAALTRAARAFTLYDPGNALVRQFLADYKAKGEAATASGPVALEVRPFELVRGGETVYREEDRERSLAFRLFRDGVRRVTFDRRVSFEELLALLQILAIRYTGVRQSEDDAVTLLRKAEFHTISFVAVEGYVPEEEEAARGFRQVGGEPPPGFDTPLPRLPAPGPVAYVPVPYEALAALRGEEAADALPFVTIQLAAELLAWCNRGALTAGEVGQFLAEVRDYLVEDRRLAALAQLADLVERQPPGPLRDEALRGLADRRLLDVVLAALPEGSTELPPEALRLLPFVHSGAVLDLLAAEAAGARREALVALVGARLPTDAEEVVARISAVEPDVARALARAIGVRAPDHVDAAAVALLAHPDPQVQADALKAAAASAHKLPAAPFLRLIHSEVESVRIAAVEALERHGEPASAKAVADPLMDGRSVSRAEAIALGRALGRLNPVAASRLFDEWLAVKGGLFRMKPSEKETARRFAAVAGLGAMGDADVEQRIEAIAKQADDELRRHCHATLARRRAEGRRRG